MEIIQQVASHHFGCQRHHHRMTPTAWNAFSARQVQVLQFVDYRRALCTWMTLGASFSVSGKSLLAWGSWTARFVASRLMWPAPAHNLTRLWWLTYQVSSVKPRALEKALDPVALAAHMKKVFGHRPQRQPPGLAFIAQRPLCRTSRRAPEVSLRPADQLSLGKLIPPYMHWYCVLMCRIQHGDQVPCRLADGEVFTIPKPGGSGPPHALRQLARLNGNAPL